MLQWQNHGFDANVPLSSHQCHLTAMMQTRLQVCPPWNHISLLLQVHVLFTLPTEHGEQRHWRSVPLIYVMRFGELLAYIPATAASVTTFQNITRIVKGQPGSIMFICVPPNKFITNFQLLSRIMKYNWVEFKNLKKPWTRWTPPKVFLNQTLQIFKEGHSHGNQFYQFN